MIADINRAWNGLEKAEHARELALHAELIRYGSSLHAPRTTPFTSYIICCVVNYLAIFISRYFFFSCNCHVRRITQFVAQPIELYYNDVFRSFWHRLPTLSVRNQ